MAMIDLHTHILPGVDDGASTLEESVELARALVDQGVLLAAATPPMPTGGSSSWPRSVWRWRGRGSTSASAAAARSPSIASTGSQPTTFAASAWEGTPATSWSSSPTPGGRSPCPRSCPAYGGKR